MRYIKVCKQNYRSKNTGQKIILNESKSVLLNQEKVWIERKNIKDETQLFNPMEYMVQKWTN